MSHRSDVERPGNVVDSVQGLIPQQQHAPAMPLWTFLVDYDGGNYTGQGAGDTFSQACDAWAAQLRQDKPLQRRTAAFVKALLKAAPDPVALNGLQNVWCFTGLFADELFIVNVVLTVETISEIDGLPRASAT
ncbi:hypothetical protein [Roseateles puraquae]|nr:hypothetical protein [Roseateles puraquae]MDG0856514.1 hypothetical protein [Roseateles puraquae]